VCGYVLFVCPFNFRFSLLLMNVWLYFCISVFIFINVFVLFPKKCVYVSVSVFVSVFITSFTDIFYHDPLLLPVLFSSLFRKDIDRQGRPTKSAAGMVNTTKSQKQRYKQLKETKNRIDWKKTQFSVFITTNLEVRFLFFFLFCPLLI